MYYAYALESEPVWLKCEENEEARRLFFNPEEPRICIFRAREEPQ